MEVITEEERILILNWVLENQHRFTNLRNSRLTYKIQESDLPLIFEVKNRIIEREGLQDNPLEPILGDFIGVILPGGHIHPHLDTNKGPLIHVRFNLFIQLPKKGCVTYYNHERLDSVERCYAKCYSGIHLHYSDVNEDTISRIVISYGFLC